MKTRFSIGPYRARSECAGSEDQVVVLYPSLHHLGFVVGLRINEVSLLYRTPAVQPQRALVSQLLRQRGREPL